MKPERTCVACGRKGEKVSLFRYVWRDDGPQMDEAGSASGRGAYCCRSPECVSRFMNMKKKWKRVFRL